MINTVLAFAFVSLGMALTPRPNMIYLISRSICQGKSAGLVSLAGTGLGFIFYICCAAFGVTALLVTITFAYDTLKIAGALYLLYLAWKTSRSPISPFEMQNSTIYSKPKLFAMGFLTNLLNPKIALMYLALLPQFIHPHEGNVLTQMLLLGSIQIIISLCVNAFLIITASTFTDFLQRKPSWLKLQKWIMSTVFVGLATQILLTAKK